jgi:hypothetical protein
MTERKQMELAAKAMGLDAQWDCHRRSNEGQATSKIRDLIGKALAPNLWPVEHNMVLTALSDEVTRMEQELAHVKAALMVGASEMAAIEAQEPTATWIGQGTYPQLKWRDGYVAKPGDKLYLAAGAKEKP